jgi:hypothetical protein
MTLDAGSNADLPTEPLLFTFHLRKDLAVLEARDDNRSIMPGGRHEIHGLSF